MLRPEKRNAAMMSRTTARIATYSAVSFALSIFAALAQAQTAAAAAKPDITKGQTIASQVCAACHAADGNSASPANPKLAQQHPEYLVKQLQNFKVKPGAKEAERVNAIMAGFAAGLSDEDMRNVAAFYAKQTQKLGTARGTKENLTLGEQLYRAGVASKGLPACAGCHGPTGSGIPAQYPRLSGQWAEYTATQLTAFREGGRKNNVQMSQIAAKMTDKEIKAVADYIAGLR
jgi:cytochrome c553